MTRVERCVLTDLNDIASALTLLQSKHITYAPGCILHALISLRTEGSQNIKGTLRGLIRRGYLTFDRERDLYFRTRQEISSGELPGMMPELLPPGIITRLTLKWNKGETEFTDDDLYDRIDRDATNDGRVGRNNRRRPRGPHK